MIESGRFPLAVLLPALTLIQAADQSQSSAFRNSAPDVRYVGSQVCSSCHAAIFSSYSKTSMGRSMINGDDPSLLDRLPAPFTIFDNDARQYYDVLRKKDGLYQSQYALDRDGTEIFRQAWKLAYVVGSGQNGLSFLVSRDPYLFEAPLSYYTKSRVWNFSPGYEVHNFAFTRPIVAECVGCHSGRAQPLYDKPASYGEPSFTELAVGCENCHGPGELHVSERRAGRPLPLGADASIVNPRRLSGWLSDNICMKCHQGGDARIEQPGKHVEDFRPGGRLQNVMAIFKAPLNRQTASPRQVLLEHYFSMTLSKCYRVGAGKLRCVSCHDPHMEPSAQDAPAYYRSKCLTCHAPANCKLDVVRRERAQNDSCTECHMPKRTVTTIAHAALTDHRVAVGPDELLPEDVFEAGADPESGLLLLTETRRGEKSKIPGTVLLQAYASVIHDGHNEFRQRMNELLDKLARDSPKDPLVLSALARRAMLQNTPNSSQEAIRDFTSAIMNGSVTYEDSLLLAELYARQHQSKEAIQVLQKAMPANPYVREFPESLAAQYIMLGDYRNALQVARKALETFPDDETLRLLEKKAKSETLE